MISPGLLRQLATINRPPPARSPAGGPDRTGKTLEPLAAGVPCMVQPLSTLLTAFAALQDDARQAVADTRIHFAGDPLRPDDRLDERCRIEVDGVTYAVKSVRDLNSMNLHVTADCETIR